MFKNRMRTYVSYTYKENQASSFRHLLLASARDNTLAHHHSHLHVHQKNVDSLTNLLKDPYPGVIISTHADKVGLFYSSCQTAVKKGSAFLTWYTSARKYLPSSSFQEQDWLQKEMNLPPFDLCVRESWNMFQDRVTRGLQGIIIIDHAEKLKNTPHQEGFWSSLATSSSNVGGFLVVPFTNDLEYAKQMLKYNGGTKFSRLEYHEKDSTWHQVLWD